MFEFTLHGVGYGWEEGAGVLRMQDGTSHKIDCELEPGLCQVRFFRVDGQERPVPSAFQAKIDDPFAVSAVLRTLLQRTAVVNVLSVDAQRQWFTTIHKRQWGTDDLAFLTSSMFLVLGSSADVNSDRKIFSQLLGMYILALIKSFLLSRLFREAFPAAGAEEHYGGGGDTWRPARQDIPSDTEVSSEEEDGDFDEAGVIPAGLENDPDYQALTNSLREMALQVPEPALQDAAGSLEGLFTGITPSWKLSDVARSIYDAAKEWTIRAGQKGSVFYWREILFAVLYAKILANVSGLHSYTTTLRSAFPDSRPGQEGQFLPTRGISLATFFRFDVAEDPIDAGPFLAILNTFSPLVFLDLFPEDLYYENPAGGLLYRFCKQTFGLTTSKRARFNYVAAHHCTACFALVLLFCVLRPLGGGQEARYAVRAPTVLFLLYLVVRETALYALQSGN